MHTHTPVPLKLLALVLIFIFSMLLFAGISAATGMNTVISEMENVNHIKFITFVSQVFSFLVPVMIYVAIFKPHQNTKLHIHEINSQLLDNEEKRESSIKSFFGLHTPKWKNVLISVAIILISIPPIMVIAYLNKQIPLPGLFKGMEEQASGLIDFLLEKDDLLNQITAILALAIVPGVMEELFFRGTIQNEFQRTDNHHAAIWLTAFVFSFIHMQFEGFFPRFILGALLGYLYFWTKNLWVPMIAHAAFNGSQVIASFVMTEQMDKLENMEALETSNYIAALVCLIIISYLLYILYVSTVKKTIVLSSTNE